MDQRKVTVLNYPPYSPDLAFVDYFLLPKVKLHLKGRLFDSISGIQKTVTSTLNPIAKDDFNKDIKKLYDRENLCIQLEGMYVGNYKIKIVISFTQILFIMPDLNLSRRTVYNVYIKQLMDVVQ
jgi:hypothetical protein